MASCLCVPPGAAEEGPSLPLLRLLIPAPHAGCLIGRRGDIARTIRTESGAQLRLLSDAEVPSCAPGCCEEFRVVSLSGDWPALAAALGLVCAQLRSVSGADGRPRRGGLAGAGPPPSPLRLAGAASPGRHPSPAHPPAVTAYLGIPLTSAGSIIGKGGAHIAQVRTLSGARVKVHDAAAGAAERHVEICGTPEQVAHAQVLVQGFLMAAAAAAQGQGGKRRGGLPPGQGSTTLSGMMLTPMLVATPARGLSMPFYMPLPMAHGHGRGVPVIYGGPGGYGFPMLPGSGWTQ